MPEQNPNTQNNRKPFSITKVQLSTAFLLLVTACLIIIFYFAVERYAGLAKAWNSFLSVLQPFLIGFCLAFLMNPIMKGLEKKTLPFFLKKTKNEVKTRKGVRAVCTIISLIIVVGIITVFLITVVPKMYETISYLYSHLTKQIQGVLVWANDITGGRYEKSIMSVSKRDIEKGVEKFWDIVFDYLKIDSKSLDVAAIADLGISIGKTIFNVFIGLIVSVYMLMDKEKFQGQLSRINFALFSAKQANINHQVTEKTKDIFYGFIIGKIVDSIIVGIICYISCLIMKMPYAVLVSVVIGATNIIPVFGPYIGAVPTVIIIFLTNPVKGIYFLIYVIILQQVDGNIIGPKILGDSTGISSFWVVAAIVIGGGMFGVGGMLLGVPIVALIYYLIEIINANSLAKKGYSTSTNDYVHMKYMNEETGEIVKMTKEEIERPRKYFNTPPIIEKKEKKKK